MWATRSVNKEPFLTASQLRVSVRQDGRRGGRGGMAVKMREGEHKHRQTGRQADRHVIRKKHGYTAELFGILQNFF